MPERIKNKMEKISVVILSGGKSSRMGQDKARLSFHGQSFVDHIAEEMGQSDEILFSVKNESDFPEIELKHIEDQYPGCGPLAGIHSALKACRNPWLFVIACDTPFIRWKNVEELYSFTQGQKSSYAIIPKEEDGRLHVLCGLYHKNMLDRLDYLLSHGIYRVRQALDENHTLYIPVEEFTGYETSFKNINTMDEYMEVGL